MIAIDTSALMALLLGEPEAKRFGLAIFHAGQAHIAAPTAFEFLMVAQGRKGTDRAARAVLTKTGARVVPWTEDHALLASEAFARFGKGQGHPAQLNFGDCMSYALAKSLDAPLLFKGDDFARTDIRSAL